MDPVYGYEAVNVEAQSRSLSSLLSATKRLIAVRKSTLAFGRGTMTFIRPDNRSVLCLCPPVSGRGHPLRRQSVALGAGDRTRSVRLEGPHSAGDARPHAFPGDRRTALHDHAGALRLLLVPAAGARQVRAPAPPSAVPEFETLVVPLGLDLGVAGAHARRVRARRAAGLSGADPLVSGAIAEGDPADADFGYPVLRHRRQPALARLLRDDAARRHDALRAADADRMGALRPRALQSARACRRPPGRPRRNAARRRHRPDLHRAAAAQSTGSRSSSRTKNRASGWSSGRPAASPTGRSGSPNVSEPSRPSSPTARRWSTNDYVVKIYRKLEAGINPEIEMGRFLTEVAGFANTPALARQRRTGRGRPQERDRVSSMPSCPTRATPGP